MSDREYKVGQRVVVKLSGGRIEQATIRALIESTEGLRLQVDFGHKDDPPHLFTSSVGKVCEFAAALRDARCGAAS